MGALARAEPTLERSLDADFVENIVLMLMLLRILSALKKNRVYALCSNGNSRMGLGAQGSVIPGPQLYSPVDR